MSQTPEQEDPSRTEGCSQLPGASKPIPERLSSFRIEATIGSGGMGAVYRAYDESMRRYVALKVLHPSFGLSDTAQERFARESWIAGQLEHPNIIRVFTRGEEAGHHYFAMELADGGSLAEHIKRLRAESSANSDVSRTVDSAHVRFLLERFIPVTEALEMIHARGFIHRDIKPHNILLCGEEKHFKLTDFGIAHADDMTRVTRAGDFIGTIKYMSPELLAAHRAGIDRRTDIYSLGVTLYEALTLSLPYNAETEEKYVSEILAGRIVPARRRNRRLPVDLETVLLKATDHDPERRYQSARELAEDLRAVLADRPIRAKRPGPIRRVYKLFRRHRAPVLFMAILIGALGGGAWLFNRSQVEVAQRQRILQILRSAVASKRAPAEIDSDWNKLSPVLADAVIQDTDDSLVSWFHRASGTFRFTQFELEGRIALFLKSLEVLPGRADTTSPLFALITDIDLAIDTGDLAPLATAWSYYTLSRQSGSCGTEIPLDSLSGGSAGVHSFQFRVISRHYRGARLCEPYDGATMINAGEGSTAPIRDALQAGKLVLYGFDISAISLNREGVIAVSDIDSILVQPFLVDTVFEQLSVVVNPK